MWSVSFIIAALIQLGLGRHLDITPHAQAAHVAPKVRIINGTDAAAHTTPYVCLVVLLVDGEEHVCGGTLIDKQFVLTAAHCLNKPNTDIDRVGLGLYNFNQSEPVQEPRAAAVFIHEEFAAHHQALHDVALIKLERPANIVPRQVEVAKLPAAVTYPDQRDSYEGQGATLYGWGKTLNESRRYPQALQRLEVRVLPQAQCGPGGALCLLRTSGSFGVSCAGDDGGPVVAAGVLIGVIGQQKQANCRLNQITAFARVDYHVDWIKKKIQEMA